MDSPNNSENAIDPIYDYLSFNKSSTPQNKDPLPFCQRKINKGNRKKPPLNIRGGTVAANRFN